MLSGCFGELVVDNHTFRCELTEHDPGRLHRGRRCIFDKKGLLKKRTGEPVAWREGDQDNPAAVTHLSKVLAPPEPVQESLWAE